MFFQNHIFKNFKIQLCFSNSIIQEAKEYVGFDKPLRYAQLRCLQALCNDNDVLAVLPAGYGKSLTPYVISLREGIPL